jgi:hypothetical protein
MKRWIAAAVGLFGLVAYVRRRRRPAELEAEPADELRAKLAETRAAPAPEPEPEQPAPEPEPDAVADRRQDVHDRARAAIDDLG